MASCTTSLRYIDPRIGTALLIESLTEAINLNVCPGSRATNGAFNLASLQLGDELFIGHAL